MSAVAKPKPPPPRPRAGQHRRPAFQGRIEGLGSPAPSSLRASTPTPIRAPTPAVSQTRSKPLCPNPDCPDRSKVVRSDQGLICESCGALVQEESGLVSEQGFGETESGRIVAQGTQVGGHQSHAKTFRAGGGFGNAGRESTTASERSILQARRIMHSYVPLLGIQESEIDTGIRLFSFACTLSFLQGRTIDSVAVVALYIACRRKKEQIQGVRVAVYSLMLIDFAEKLNMDVFALGRIYHDLYKKLYWDFDTREWKKGDGSREYKEASQDFQGLDPAVLVPRFVQDLNFDKRDEPKIRNDAIQILKRMKRDWIQVGRRPSGVVGAAVLLAARMNNYRRTTREIVLTAKVTEITINKRLEEFQETQASNLSVMRFREEAKNADAFSETRYHWLDEKQPPVTKAALKPKVKKKRGRPRKHPLPENAAEVEDDNSPELENAQQSPDDQTPPAKRARVDAEGYKIPDIPARRSNTDTTHAVGETPTADAEGETQGTPSSSQVGHNDIGNVSRESSLAFSA